MADFAAPQAGRIVLTPDTGNQAQEAGHEEPGTGNRIQLTGYRKPDMGNRAQETGNRKPDRRIWK